VLLCVPREQTHGADTLCADPTPYGGPCPSRSGVARWRYNLTVSFGFEYGRSAVSTPQHIIDILWESLSETFCGPSSLWITAIWSGQCWTCK
jgi:hypothetical protein